MVIVVAVKCKRPSNVTVVGGQEELSVAKRKNIESIAKILNSSVYFTIGLTVH